MNIKKKFISGMALLAVAASCMTSAFTGVSTTVNAVDDRNDDWLHAVGSRLYDKDGNEVWLTGANWFGLNCIEYSPHYLYAGDIDDMLSEVADRGINVIRFPISTELILSWMEGKPYQIGAGGMQASYNPPQDEDDGNGGVIKAGTYGNINKDFVEADGKTLITSDRGFDVILDKCKKYGIKAFIDIHSPHADNSGHNYNLWYGKETKGNTDAGMPSVMVTTDIWIDTLVWLADKYKNNDTLIGYDLKNEPHGKGQEGKDAAKWDGSTDENNWAYAATTCADAILDVNPNALIFIEGVEQSLSGAMAGDYWGIADRRDNSPYIGAWWGGNFRGAREYPIKPKHGTSQIVYSPHDYGPSVYAQTWFDKDFTEQTLLDDYWYDTWAYINEENIAPLLIGEWGGHMDGAENQKWMELLRDYMIKKHINHTFWCLNTNSGDTGGLWAGFSYSINSGTEITWEEKKYELFKKSLWQTDSGKFIGLDHKIPLGQNGTGMSLSEFYASGEDSNLDSGGKTDPKPPVDVPTDPTKPAVTTATAAPTTTPTTTRRTTASYPATTTAPTPTTSSADPAATTAVSTTASSPQVTTADVITTVTSAGNTETKPVNTLQPTTTVPTNDDYPTIGNETASAYGDVNLDEEINVADVVTLSLYLLDSNSNPLTDDPNKIKIALANADCVRDYQITPADSSIIMNFVAMMIDYSELGKASTNT